MKCQTQTLSKHLTHLDSRHRRVSQKTDGHIRVNENTVKLTARRRHRELERFVGRFGILQWKSKRCRSSQWRKRSSSRVKAHTVQSLRPTLFDLIVSHVRKESLELIRLHSVTQNIKNVWNGISLTASSTNCQMLINKIIVCVGIRAV